jgi:hypothetical protein
MIYPGQQKYARRGFSGGLLQRRSKPMTGDLNEVQLRAADRRLWLANPTIDTAA